MSLEDQLKEELRGRLDPLGATSGDPAGAMRTGQRMVRRRRTAVVGGVVAAVVAIGVGTSVIGDLSTGDPEPAAKVPLGAPGWSAARPAPDTARSNMLVEQLGDEIVFAGGRGLGGHASNEAIAYDYQRDSWRTLPDAPSEFLSGTGTVSTSAGETMVVVEERSIMLYDSESDAWRGAPQPPLPLNTYFPLVAGDDEGTAWFVAKSGRVMALDTADDSWVLLPESQNQPAISAREALVAVPGGVAVSVTVREPSVDGAARTWAEVWDGTSWRRIQTGQSTDLSHWTGSHLVGLDDGGAFAEGGVLARSGRVDLSSGQWTGIAARPDTRDGLAVFAASGPLIVDQGEIYDGRTDVWTTMPAPPEEEWGFTSAEVVGDQIFVWGGDRGARAGSRQLFVYTLDEPSESESPATETEGTDESGRGASGLLECQPGQIVGQVILDGAHSPSDPPGTNSLDEAIDFFLASGTVIDDGVSYSVESTSGSGPGGRTVQLAAEPGGPITLVAEFAGSDELGWGLTSFERCET